MKAALLKAYSDTFSSGVVQPTLTAVVGFGVVFSVIDRRNGWQQALGELENWFIGSFGALVAIGVLFVFNLCLAPFRLEQAKRLEAEQSVRLLDAKVAELSKPVPQLNSTITLITYGDNKKEYPGQVCLTLFLSLTNSGDRQSVAKDFQVFLVQGDSRVEATLLRTQGQLRLEVDGGMQVFEPEAQILRRASRALEPGTMQQGYIICAIDEKLAGLLSFPACQVLVQFTDAFGGSHSVSADIAGGQKVRGVVPHEMIDMSFESNEDQVIQDT